MTRESRLLQKYRTICLKIDYSALMVAPTAYKRNSLRNVLYMAQKGSHEK